MVFMAQNEAAFDEATCPYQVMETREVAEGVEVREDARRCQADVEEHRWVLLREEKVLRFFGTSCLVPAPRFFLAH